jgi:hypothetical protein
MNTLTFRLFFVLLGASVGNIWPTKPQRITKVYSLPLLTIKAKNTLTFSLFFVHLSVSYVEKQGKQLKFLIDFPF